LRVTGIASDLRSAVQRAAEVIDSGVAEAKLERWARLTQEP
jgi:anthranilate phosphoribosyltransferase